MGASKVRPLQTMGLGCGCILFGSCYAGSDRNFMGKAAPHSPIFSLLALLCIGLRFINEPTCVVGLVLSSMICLLPSINSGTSYIPATLQELLRSSTNTYNDRPRINFHANLFIFFSLPPIDTSTKLTYRWTLITGRW